MNNNQPNIDSILQEITSLSLESRDRLAEQLTGRPELFPNWILTRRQDERERILVIDKKRFGPVERLLLSILQEDESIGISEDDLLRQLWGNTRKIPRRKLQQRLAVRVGILNQKLIRLREPWEIVRTPGNNQEEASYQLVER